MAARSALLIVFGLSVVACGPRSGDGPTPAIPIEQRGLAGRLALMDRYRLHDEDRHRMMERPRIWVEELPDEPEADPSADAPASDAGP